MDGSLKGIDDQLQISAYRQGWDLAGEEHSTAERDGEEGSDTFGKRSSAERVTID